MTRTPRSSVLETRNAAEEFAERRSKLQSLEATLFEARLGADLIDGPELVYFIDMAIAEVRRIMTIDQETQSPQDDRKSLNSVRPANSPAKVA